MADFKTKVATYTTQSATLSGIEYTLESVDDDYLTLKRTSGAVIDEVHVPLAHVTAIQVHTVGGVPRLTVQTITLRNP